jgi:hypothetical protein
MMYAMPPDAQLLAAINTMPINLAVAAIAQLC